MNEEEEKQRTNEELIKYANETILVMLHVPFAELNKWSTLWIYISSSKSAKKQLISE